jgi:hypothetical protein
VNFWIFSFLICIKHYTKFHKILRRSLPGVADLAWNDPDATAASRDYLRFYLGMHRILFLPDIRQIKKPDTGYPAGYLVLQLYFW